MAEWPKKMYSSAEPDDTLSGTEVIPADLGRELRDAVRRLLDDDDNEAIIKGSAALARYEREVGK